MKLSALNFPAELSPKHFPPLPKKFFLRNTSDVAHDLIGKGLYLFDREEFLVQITEVEAYLGAQDPASHAFRGLTKRNWPMFEEGGTCYVYLSYGLNFCMNVSTQQKGTGEAILFRAAQPLLGKEPMKLRRKTSVETSWLSGPGKLTQALGINLAFNGRRFDESNFKLIDLPCESCLVIGRSPRIGISKAQDLPLRFFLEGSRWLSRKKTFIRD